MANPDHLSKLKEGIAAWNEWRSQYDQTIPDLDGADLVAAELSGADLRRVHLNAADLSNADLSRANLNWAYLNNEANLSGAILRRASVDAAELTGANLSNAELSVARFRGTDFRGANLSMANLDRSDLRRANFSLLDLSGRYRKTNLSGAYLGGANLSEANLTGALLKEADLSGANLSNANFSGADLTGAKLQSTLAVGTIFAEADLTGCKVHGIAAWDLKLEGAKQSKLIITAEGEQPPIQVDDLEVAQFIYLLLNRKRLRKVITMLGEKAVFILGRFTERRDLLDGIADKLRSLGYLPIIFDFERPTDRDLTETVKILAGLSRFVIADITNPSSVPLELQATVPEYMVPFVTIAQRGQPRFSMFNDLPAKYHWALPLLEYNTKESLLASFRDKVELPALDKLAEVRRLKAMTVPVRSAED